MALRVAVSGTGNMGRLILRALEDAPDLEVVGVLELYSSGDRYTLPSGAGVPLRQAVDRIRDLQAEVVVDFTNAAWTEQLLPAAIAAGVHPVIGTSGLSEALVAQAEAACAQAKLGGVIAPNFALGAVLLMHLARIAAPFFDAAEVIELHHAGKVDAPSGTAIATARAMRAARDRDFDRNVAEQESLSHARGAELGGVSLHAVRLPGLVAHQAVLFGGVGETLTLRHDTLNRESFLPGVMHAVRTAPQLDHLVVGLDRVLGLTD